MIALLGVAGLLLAGCAQHHNKPVVASHIPLDIPSSQEPSVTITITPPTTPPASSSASASPTLHPVPSTPLRTATVNAVGGRHYVIQVWAQTSDVDCADHAYGQVATFLTQHSCTGMVRQLATAVVGGKQVGFATTAIDLPGTDSAHPYDNAAAFRQLVNADNTGSVNDLLREGWRLPSGPAAVPSPDAFDALAQDAGVTVYDLWYLDGSTPANDPALLQFAQDVYLQY